MPRDTKVQWLGGKRDALMMGFGWWSGAKCDHPASPTDLFGLTRTTPKNPKTESVYNARAVIARSCPQTQRVWLGLGAKNF